MKKGCTKVVGIVAASISAVAFILEIASLIASALYVPPEGTEQIGLGLPFQLWIYSVLISIPSLVLYTIDAVFSFVNARFRENRWFNIFFGVFLLGGVPMLWFFGGSADYLLGSIWYVYYFAMLVLEVVSIIRHKRAKIYW